MLKPSKMFSDLMFAVSMYFADALKKRLLKYNEHFWSLLLVASFVTLWLRAEHKVAAYKKSLGDAPLALRHEVFFEVIYLFSQTLVFLLVQITIQIVDESVSEQSLWMESIVMPCLLIVFCVIVVTFSKKMQLRHED